MRYEKPALTFEQQADLLLGRGLVADRTQLIARLQTVNYYRLSGYLFPFRLADNRIRAGTTLDTVWQHYTFDRQLRIITMDAVERVEVAVRTQLAYQFSHTYGPFAYAASANMPGLRPEEHQRWLDELKVETERSKEPFIKHFREKYGDEHDALPLWMLVEVMSFGKTLTFYNGVEREVRRGVALLYQIPDEVLQSWLRALNAVRNICAHHGRLWNRELGYKPKLPHRRKYPEWHEPVQIPQGRVFAILTILRYLLHFVAPTSKWETRLRKLLDDNPNVSRQVMGFPERWSESVLWK